MLNRARSAARRRLRGAPPQPSYADLPSSFHAIRARAAPYTMTSLERMYALYEATRHVVQTGIAGAVVECGVWRGGSSMLAALTLLEVGVQRDLWLYDTFEGMTEPTEHDRAWTGDAASDKLAESERVAGAYTTWAYATIEDVQANMRLTGYPTERVHYVAGKVEDTIPAEAPDEIALLRLDTDWYESTRHELEQLWPRLQPGGVLIIDDYGHWQGARQAVDEFFARLPKRPLLHRVDYTARVAIKLDS